MLPYLLMCYMRYFSVLVGRKEKEGDLVWYTRLNLSIFPDEPCKPSVPVLLTTYLTCRTNGGGSGS